MENFFREIALMNEAYDITHNLPCKRRFSHEELESALKVIQELESASKLKAPTGAMIDAAMMEIIK